MLLTQSLGQGWNLTLPRRPGPTQGLLGEGAVWCLARLSEACALGQLCRDSFRAPCPNQPSSGTGESISCSKRW